MIYKFTLNPANRNVIADFQDIEKKSQIFSKAASNCTNGATFQRYEKKVFVREISQNYIKIDLYSPCELTSPKRTLSAYSRELIRLNKNINLLDNLIYNHTIFRTELIETKNTPQKSIDDVSSTDLVKSIIDLLYSTTNNYNIKLRKKTIEKLKEIMLPFINNE